MAKQTQTPKTAPKPLDDLKYDVKDLTPIGDTYKSFADAMDKIQTQVGHSALALVLSFIAIGKTLLEGLSTSIDCLGADYSRDHLNWFLEYNRERGKSTERGNLDNLRSKLRSVTIAFHVFPRILNTLQTLNPDGQGMTNFYYFASVIASKKAKASRRYDNLVPLWEKMSLIPLATDVTSYQRTIDSIYGKKKVERAKASKAKPANTAGNPNFGDENSSISVKTPEKAMVAASTIPGNPEVNGSTPEDLGKANNAMLSLSFADRCKVVGAVFSPAEEEKLVLYILDRLPKQALESIKRYTLDRTSKNPVVIPSQAAQASSAPSVPAVN